MRERLLQLTLLIIVGFSICSRTCAQDEHQVTSTNDRFPYAFDNFVWWSDTDLRIEVQKHLPTLREEIERGSPVESRVRTALVQILREKGIQAEVQVIEPSMDIRSSKRAPDAPPPSIVYSVLSPPEVLVDKVMFKDSPPDGLEALNSEAHGMEGKPYHQTLYWLYRHKMVDNLQQLGYLSSAVTLNHGIPRKEGARYVVSVEATVAAGSKYHVASIKADGGPLVQGRDLSQFFAVRSGDVAVLNPFGKLVGALRSVYWHAGYADVDFAGSPVLDQAHALASYQLQVTPGPLYHLRDVKFANLDLSQVAKAREMLGLEPGDVYDVMAVSNLNRKLLDANSPLRAYGFSYTAKEDKQDQLVDLVLTFYKQ